MCEPAARKPGNIYETHQRALVCAVQPTCKVALREEMLDKVCICWEQQVVQLVHTHADGGVDVQTPIQVGAERLHLAWTERNKHKVNWFGVSSFDLQIEGDKLVSTCVDLTKKSDYSQREKEQKKNNAGQEKENI